jgi:hypothetical protein
MQFFIFPKYIFFFFFTSRYIFHSALTVPFLPHNAFLPPTLDSPRSSMQDKAGDNLTHTLGAGAELEFEVRRGRIQKKLSNNHFKKNIKY